MADPFTTARQEAAYDVAENDKARQKALDQVKMYQANDWELYSETPEYFLLKKNTSTVGWHLVIFLFTWWTLGLCNLAYYLLSNKSKKIIK